MGVPSKCRLAKFGLILFLFALFITEPLLSQTIIKEKIIIKPRTLTNPTIMTNEGCAVGFIVNWSAGTYEGFVGMYNSQGWVSTGGWSTGGSVSCSATVTDLSTISYQIRLNLPENVTSYFSYSIVINGVTVQIGTGTLTGKFLTAAYTNIDFQPTYYNGFDFELIDSRYGWSTGELYMNRKANVSLSPFLNCDTIPFIPNSALIKLTIEPEIESVSLFNWETRDTVGWSQTVRLDEASNYYVALLPDYYSNEERIIKVTASYKSYNKSDTLRIPPRYYSILTEPTRVYMNWLNKNVDVFGFLGDWEEPLPDTIQYNLEILNDNRLIDVILWNTGEKGKLFYNIPHDYGYFGFEVIPTSEKPLNDDTLKIRISTTDPRINPAEVEVIYPAQRMLVEFNPKTIMPGDTADVILKKIEENGSLSNFPQDQLFDFRIIGGEHYGTIFVPEYGDTTDEGWYVEQGFKFIASAPIENLPVESLLMVKTSEGFAGSKLPVDRSQKEDYKKHSMSFIKRTNQLQKSNTTENNKPPDINKSMMIGDLEKLWGIGKIIIGHGNDCSDAPQCEEQINPVINFVQIDTSICNENTDADGITKFYTSKFEKEFNLDACYSQTLDKWQFQIITPLKYSSEICYKPDRIYLADTVQLKTLSFEELCRAQDDIINFENSHRTIFKIVEIIRKHENIHVEQSIKLFNEALESTRFIELLKLYTLRCDDASDLKKAIIFALNHFKTNLIRRLKQDFLQRKKNFEGDPYSENLVDVANWITNEEMINNNSEIIKLRDTFLNAAIRLNKCID